MMSHKSNEKKVSFHNSIFTRYIFFKRVAQFICVVIFCAAICVVCVVICATYEKIKPEYFAEKAS